MTASLTDQENLAGNTPQQDVKPVDSSSADSGGSMLDAVLSATAPDKEKSLISAPDSTKAPDTQSTDGQAPKASEIDPEDLSDGEISQLHHKTKKQIHKLLGQRKDLEYHVSALRPKAEQYDAIVSRIRETGLDGADLNNLFEIGTLMKKGDLFGAREKLLPYVETILRATGGVLPPDLEAARAAGQISEQHARELAEMRSRNVLNTHQNQIAEQGQAQEAGHQLIGGLVNAVNDWEQGKRRSDPDWGLKAPEIKAALELAIFKGAQPKSVQEAVAMAENALSAVEAKLKQFRPAPKPFRPVSGSLQASTATGTPKTMLEAITQGMTG